MRSLIGMAFVSIMPFAVIQDAAAGEDAMSKTLSMKETVYEYVYHNFMATQLASLEVNFLSDCSLAMHINSNLVFNDTGDRFSMKAQGLSRAFSSAWSTKSNDANFATHFYQVVSNPKASESEIATAALAKMNECNVALKRIDDEIQMALKPEGEK